jgi:hypothetical protein
LNSVSALEGFNGLIALVCKPWLLDLSGICRGFMHLFAISNTISVNFWIASGWLSIFLLLWGFNGLIALVCKPWLLDFSGICRGFKYAFICYF